LDQLILWLVFGLGISFVLALDLGVLNRKAHTLSIREAAGWSATWFILAMLFAVGVFRHRGAQSGLEFLTGYLIELSLSVDNVFLFAVIFNYFAVPDLYRKRVLFWGILSAIVMRGAMILAGAALIARFHWIILVFGGFLIITGIKMYLHRNEEVDVSENSVLKYLRKRLRVTETYHGQSFIARVNGRLYATPLLLVLAMVELTDLMFAVDSIPAIFAVTRDPFIVFTSNVFAILGLRSLYFLLAGIMDKFYYLKTGLSAILVFVGIKMVISMHVKIPIGLSLAVVALILAISIVASLMRPTPPTKNQPAVEA
jgi:tellurite resistance protein TerC